ncbi:MAG: COG4280 domain-containing protein [Candidatus Dormibacteraceae bacterium]
MSILVVLATFLAAGVEWVEALTIVLAVGLFRGWRSAITGALLAVAALILLVAAFGFAITSHVSIAAARTVVGVFLLLFGLKWLHKAILRSGGLVPLHDEAKAFERTREVLSQTGDASAGGDRVGLATSFGGVFLEGLEVVFIVVALGGLRSVGAAATGAAASLIVVLVTGFALRRPLTQVPENAMKYIVGIMLTSFGTFFAGEGIGVRWWRADLSLLPLIAAYALSSLLLVRIIKAPPRGALAEIAAVRAVRSGVLQVWGLFVDDGSLAIVAVAVLFGVAIFADHFTGRRGWAGVLLVLGVLLAIAIGLTGAIRQHPRAATASPGAPAATRNEKAPGGMDDSHGP